MASDVRLLCMYMYSSFIFQCCVVWFRKFLVVNISIVCGGVIVVCDGCVGIVYVVCLFFV